MKRISLLCLMLFLVACGSETDTGLGMLNQPPSLTIKEQQVYRYAISLQNASDEAVVTINDLPAWAEFDAEENVISGTPEHTDADQEYIYSISVVDGDERFDSDDVSIRVEHSILAINTLPRSRTQVRELSEFSQTVSVDSDLQSLTYSLLNAPEWMSIDEQGRISGTPTHKYLGEIHSSIQVRISDGTHEVLSDEFEVSVVEILNLHPEITVESNVDGDFHINQDIEIDFGQLVYINTISVDAPNGACVSNIQISDDNFETCIELFTIIEEPVYDYSEEDPEKSAEENAKIKEKEKLDAEKKVWEKNKLPISTKNLAMNTNYQLRMTSHVLEGFDFSLDSDHNKDFFTIGGLMVSEVGSKVDKYGQHWLELYNATGQEINLQDYVIRSQGVESAGCDAEIGTGCIVSSENDFQLKDRLVAPGEYIIVREDDWSVPNDDTINTTYIGNGIFPYWGVHGYIEIINSSENKTDDFVSFGNWYDDDQGHITLSADAWISVPSQAGPPTFGHNEMYSGSIGRMGGLFDSNSRDDWFVYNIHTAGFANEISLDDEDLDGIPDYAELEGVVYAGMKLYDMGARQGVKDIFVELDYMDSSEIAVTPRKEALDKVVSVFSQQNIALHFDVGELFSSTLLEDYNLGGGNQVEFFSGITFYPSYDDTREKLYNIKADNIGHERLPVFHYMLMAYSQEENFSGGAAEQLGNDSLITIGDWGLSLDNEQDKNEIINIQASMIMHQLGHNLGLDHGGDVSEALKPNYLSTMNPLYALEGLATVGSNEGDRYYFRKYTEENLCVDQVYEDQGGSLVLRMTNSVSDSYDSFMIDFSSVESVLDEASILEQEGLNLTGSTPVDFNCSGLASDTLFDHDVNFDGNLSELSQPSDWSNIELRFQGNGRDHSSDISYEEPPSSKFLERIQDL